MLTLHRLPRAYRVLYVGIAALLGAALLSHWARLALRHGVSPGAVAAWYLGDETAMLFGKTGGEVAEDAWMNLFHHTLAFLVLGGLLVRTDAAPRTKALIGTLFAAGVLTTAAGPPLVWWGVPGAAALYVGALALLSGLGLVAAGLVTRDAVVRRAPGHRGIAGGDVLARALPALGALALVPVSLSGQAQVHLTEREAIRQVFPDARWIATDTIAPGAAARAALEEDLGRGLYEPVYVVRRIYRETELLGYSVVTDERGKYRPITILVGVDPTGRVAGVRILVYREPRGGEVARQYFLRQYRGKTMGDPIRLNRDIINISGATISVQSVNASVRKVLALIARYSPLPSPRSLLPLEEVP